MRKHTYMNIGMISFIVVAIVLSLVTFATLSYVTARDNYALAKRYATHEQAYYALENQAYSELKHIKTILQTSTSENAALVSLKEHYSLNGHQVTITKSNSMTTFTLIIDIDYPHYSIHSSYTTPLKKWKKEESLHIL